MRLTANALIALAVLAAGSASAEDHLAPQAAVSARLAAATRTGAAERASLDRALATPDAERTAHRLGVDIRDVRAAAATLTDAEARELSERASALKSDPAAGLSQDVDHLLVVFLIVAIVILVLKAVD